MTEWTSNSMVSQWLRRSTQPVAWTEITRQGSQFSRLTPSKSREKLLSASLNTTKRVSSKCARSSATSWIVTNPGHRTCLLQTLYLECSVSLHKTSCSCMDILWQWSISIVTDHALAPCAPPHGSRSLSSLRPWVIPRWVLRVTSSPVASTRPLHPIYAMLWPTSCPNSAML